MQQIDWLRRVFRTQIFQLGWSEFQNLCIGSTFAVAVSASNVLYAEDINTLSANTSCDEVTVRQAARSKSAENEVDWFALDRKQREYAGQELLPEHQEAEPEHDTITGCAIKEKGEANGTRSADDQTEMVGLNPAWAASRADDTASTSPDDTDGTNADHSSVQDRAEQSLLDKLFSAETNLILKFVVIIVFAGFLIAVAFGLNYLKKVVSGLLNRRRVCMVPASVISGTHEITGHITILGLTGSRFVPDGKSQCAYLQRLFDEPQPYFFDLIVGDLKFEVFLDTLRGHFVPCMFDKSLTVKQQKKLLTHSTKEPQIGQLIAVRTDATRHKAHMRARASYMKRNGNENRDAVAV